MQSHIETCKTCKHVSTWARQSKFMPNTWVRNHEDMEVRQVRDLTDSKVHVMSKIGLCVLEKC